ncbi:MAG: S53 family peptidase [Clostridia bacterium]|nr:S53 family peptidase [Clostridia bacterium]
MKSCLKINSVSDSSSAGYTPFQIRKAYNLSTKYSGGGIKIAVIAFFENPNIGRNLDVFSDEFSLKRTTINTIGNATTKDFDFSAYIEPCVDTQWIHAISPESELTVVYAPSYTPEGAMSAVELALDNGADIIIQTYQAPFLEEYTRYSEVFRNASFIASAGDYGYGAFFPSCYENVISVGGTVLEIDSDGTRISEETVWSGTGGGISPYIDIPSYQRKFIPIDQITSGKRAVPDVSFLASSSKGFSVYHSSADDRFGWYTVEGTSISASIIAGITANMMSAGFIGKENLPQVLYGLAGELSYINKYNLYNDIKRGSNGKYTAMHGYDLCTGLGSLMNI